jgi:hypothetical protein
VKRILKSAFKSDIPKSGQAGFFAPHLENRLRLQLFSVIAEPLNRVKDKLNY